MFGITKSFDGSPHPEIWQWYTFWWSEEKTPIGDWASRRLDKSVFYFSTLHADLYGRFGVEKIDGCREDRHVGALVASL